MCKMYDIVVVYIRELIELDREQDQPVIEL